MGTRKRIAIALTGLAVAGAGGAWWMTRPRLPSPPEVPAQIEDPVVRDTLTAARQAVVANPRSGEAWGELGMIFRAHALNGQSNDCFREAAHLDPTNPRWPYLIGTLQAILAPDQAEPDLRKAYQLASGATIKSTARVRLAELLIDTDKETEARELLAEELRENPANPRAHFQMGVVLANLRDDAGSIKHLTQAATSPYARQKATALLANVARRGGDETAARRYEDESRRASADLPWPDPMITESMKKETGRSARVRKAEELDAQGRYAEALVIFEELVQTYPDDQATVNLGITLAKMGNYPRAEQVLRAALVGSPDHAAGHYFLGIALFLGAEQRARAGQSADARPIFEEALKELKRAAELKPDNGLAYLFQGNTLKELGRPNDALVQYREAIRVAPQILDNHLALGRLLVELKQVVEARAVLTEAVRLSPPGDTRAQELLKSLEPTGK